MRRQNNHFFYQWWIECAKPRIKMKENANQQKEEQTRKQFKKYANQIDSEYLCRRKIKIKSIKKKINVCVLRKWDGIFWNERAIV